MTDRKPAFNLEERTYDFALRVRQWLKDRDWPPVSWTDVNQLLRSSGSVAANYIEAQEAISDSDFVHRMRISRKESKESGLWLRLLADTNPLSPQQSDEHFHLLRETVELTRIFTAIIKKKASAP
jgi:four helix bundle protein